MLHSGSRTCHSLPPAECHCLGLEMCQGPGEAAAGAKQCTMAAIGRRLVRPPTVACACLQASQSQHRCLPMHDDIWMHLPPRNQATSGTLHWPAAATMGSAAVCMYTRHSSSSVPACGLRGVCQARDVNIGAVTVVGMQQRSCQAGQQCCLPARCQTVCMACHPQQGSCMLLAPVGLERLLWIWGMGCG